MNNVSKESIDKFAKEVIDILKEIFPEVYSVTHPDDPQK